jgi:hypothetical protein
MTDYFKINRISNSALNCIDPELGGHPEKYKDFIEGKLIQESPAMALGDIIHRRFLLGEEFVSLDKFPGEQVKQIIEAFFENTKESLTPIDIADNKAELLKVIRAHNYYNNRKDETVIDQVLKDGKLYFDFLHENKEKTVISTETYALLRRIELSMERSPIKNILNRQFSEIEESEKEIYFDLKAPSYLEELTVFPCKAKIDRLIIDHKKKSYRIIDLKTTSTALEFFTQSVMRYKYYRQMAFYREAVRKVIPNTYEEEGIYLIAIETTAYNRVRIFRMSEDFLDQGKHNFLSLLKRLSYHQQTFNWVYPLEEIENEGVYLLNNAI